MKTILITGATAGIGKHAALELARSGHHVIATGRRPDALRKLKTEAVGRLDTVELDVTSDESVERALAAVDTLTKGRGIDVLVNNAGYGQMGPLETISDGDLRRQYETNVFGLMRVTRAFVPQMRLRGEGRIVNIGSILGKITFPLMGAYASTKYVVEAMSDALRRELAPFGIAVSIVQPGPIRTGFNDRAMDTIDKTAVAASPYAPILATAERFRERFEGQASGPEVTTRAIVHASVARRPRIRYVVPRLAGIGIALLNLLPTRLLDAALAIATGLTRKRLLAAT